MTRAQQHRNLAEHVVLMYFERRGWEGIEPDEWDEADRALRDEIARQLELAWKRGRSRS